MPLFSPVSAGGIGKATVTATTGSPTVDTVSRAGKTIYKFTGSGSITIGTAGTAEVLVVGGGGAAGGGGGGGAGGYLYNASAILPSGTLTVTVGAGGVKTINYFNQNGNPSAIGYISALGGGSGGVNYSSGTQTVGAPGGSGGGGGDNSSSVSAAGGAGQLSQGNSGGAGTNYAAGNGSGGGGGSGGAGGNASTNTGGTGGAGTANSITGTSVTYAAGGGGYPIANAAGAANTGNGATSNNTGGSGIVIVVIG